MDGIHPNMEDTWDDWRLFLAAWDTGSLSAAAERLGLGQATLSRRIAALERRIGHVLFDRTRRGLAPTAAAVALAPHAEAMDSCARAASGALDGLEQAPEGVVRLAVPEGFAVDLVPALLPELARRAPAVRLEVLADNRLVDLGRREADLALRGARPEGGDLLVQRLPDVPLGLYASAGTVAGLPAGATLRDVELVQYTADLAHLPTHTWVERALDGRRPALTSNSFLALRAAVAAGTGAIVLPSLQALWSGLVEVPVPIDPPLPATQWFLVVPRPLRAVPRVAVVVQLVQDAVHAACVARVWPPPGFARGPR